MTALAWHQALAIAFPLRSQDDETSAALALRWCLHLLLWTAVLTGLWYLNGWASLERSLRSPWPGLHRVWLPLLAGPLYLIGWLSVGLWMSLRRGPTSAWPDVDAAWLAACKALTRAEIDVVRTPLFLVLGPLPCELQTSLEKLGAVALPLPGDAPFRVLAHAQAIYVVSDRLGLLDRSAPASGNDSTPLEHLGQLLLRDRVPRPPLMGVVLIVPFAATQSDADIQKATRVCQDDLRELRRGTGLDVPLFLAISGLDPMPGKPSPGDRAVWFQHFPPLPDLDPAEITTMYQQGIDGLCLTQVRRSAEARLELELAKNIRLHQWLNTFHAWRANLTKLLVEGTRNEVGEPGLVAGCYLIPSNMIETDALELTRTLCADLMAQRDAVAWTADTAVRAAQERRRTWLGFSLLGAAAAIGVLLMWRP